MSKVTRIVRSANLNPGKYKELARQAKLLGELRKEVWQRFGSINGVGLDFRELRNDWVENRDFSPLPAKAWKETLRTVLDDIKMYEAAAKEKVKRAIARRAISDIEKKELNKKLKGDDWPRNAYLSRMMRRYKKHGKTEVADQIILECGVYSQFQGKDGNTWLKIPSFKRGARIAVPLNSNIHLSGCLRLILKDGVVYVHYAIEQKKFRPCGDKIIGVDQGYSEAFADSEGGFHGTDLGQLLTAATAKRHTRGQARNKLYQIAKKNPKKSRNIYRFNLGKKKLDRQYARQKERVRNIAFQAVHCIVNQAQEVRAEDLTGPFCRKNKSKKINRVLSAWTRGSLAEALESIAKARGSRLKLVNAAYTSQMDSKTHRLEGRRVGDKFYHADGDVSHADTNSAVNVKYRADDAEIKPYTPPRVVKAILLSRLTAKGGVSSPSGYDRPSATPVARRKRTSTESESLNSGA